ncbi:hypothetical protein AAC387_Pa02g2668 [Persea americana]
MGCSLVSHFSSGRSHICKLEGKERKKESVVSMSNQCRTFTRRRGAAFVLMKSWISHLRKHSRSKTPLQSTLFCSTSSSISPSLRIIEPRSAKRKSYPTWNI